MANVAWSARLRGIQRGELARRSAPAQVASDPPLGADANVSLTSGGSGTGRRPNLLSLLLPRATRLGSGPALPDRPRVTAIGSCRIVNPMRGAAQAGRVVLKNEHVYGYVHTTDEILQLLDYREGMQIPSEIMPYLSGGRSILPCSFAEEPDIFLVELSSLRSLRFHNWALQLNYFIERFRDQPELIEIFSRTVKNGDRDGRAVSLAEHPSFAALPQMDRTVLVEAQLKPTARSVFEEEILTIVSRLPRPVVFVIHLNLPDPRGRPMESRACLAEWMTEIGQAHKLHVFDPTPHILAHGVEAAMADEGVSRTHYSPAFEAVLAEALLETLRAASLTLPPVPQRALGSKAPERLLDPGVGWLGVQAMRSRAAEQLRAGDLEGARQTAREAIVAAPPCAPASAIMAQAALRGGDPVAALAFAMNASLTDPRDAAAVTTAAKALTKLQRFAEAAEMWRGMAECRPTAAWPLIEAARCQLRAKNPTQALAAADAALAREVDDPVATAVKAEAFYALGRFDELPDLGATLASRTPEAAVAILQWLLRKGHLSGVTQVARSLSAHQTLPWLERDEVCRDLQAIAEEARQRGEWNVVGEAWRALEVIAPGDPSTSRKLSKLASQWLEPARRAADAGNFDEAEHAYAIALRISPNHDKTMRGAASVAEKRADWARAADLWALITLEANADLASLVRAARAADLAGREEQAFHLYGRAAALGPDDAKAPACLRSLSRRLAKRARALEAAEDFSGAVQVAMVVRAVFPDELICSRLVKRCEARIAGHLRAAVAGGSADEQEALALQLLQVNPLRLEALRVLSKARMRDGRLREATDLLRRLTEIEADVAGHWIKLGRCFRLMKIYDEAQAAANQALVRDPGSVAAQKILADVGQRAAC